MTYNGPFSCFAISRPLTLRTSKSCSTHKVKRCSMQMKKASGKKRVRQSYQAPPGNGKIITDVSIGDEFIGTIAVVGPANSSWVDISVFTKRGRPVHARLPFSTQKGSTSHSDVQGAVVPVYVKRINHDAGRIEVHKGLKPQCRNDNPSVFTMLDALRVGDKLEGTVVGLGPYGAVVDANVYRIGKGGNVTACHGLLQRKRFRNEWYSAADKVIKSDTETRISMGDTINIYVRAAHVQNAFLLFDAYEVRTEDIAEARQQHRTAMRRRYRRASIESLKAGELREGVVTDVARYGLFVDVGVKSNGLIHYSEMGEGYKADWKEAIDINTHLTVEIIRVENNKISLRLISLKREALQDALEVAGLATARTEDVELAEALQASSKHGHVGKVAANSTSEVKATHVFTSELEETELINGNAKYDKEDEEDQEEEDQEEEDKFSDEYFEDKYGF